MKYASLMELYVITTFVYVEHKTVSKKSSVVVSNFSSLVSGIFRSI